MCSASKNFQLIKSLKPLYYICSLVGIAPYCQNKEEIYIKTSIVLAKTILHLMFYSFVFYLMHSSVRNTELHYLLNTVIRTQDYIWWSFTVFFVILEFLVKKQVVNFFTNLQHLESEFENIYSLKDLAQSYKNMNTILFKSCFFICCCIMFTLYFDFFIYYSFDTILFFCSLPFYVSFLCTINFFAVKFISLNALLTDRFKLINRKIDSLSGKYIKESVSVSLL